MKNLRTRSRGFFFADVLTGLLLAGVLMSVLLVSMFKFHAARDRLANERTAIEAAQRALIALEMKQPMPAIPNVILRSEKRDADWIAITATCQGRSVTLLGRVPQGGAS